MQTNSYEYRLFGRSKGRGKNNKISNDAINIGVTNIDPIQYNVIDIGSGYGESVLEFAKLYNEKNIIACEKYIDGINKIAENVRKESLNNVYTFHGNAHKFLDKYCSPKSISEVWILFPDPWPKKRHHKRRLVDVDLFYKLKNFLKNNGTVNIATDSKSYISEILKCIYEVKSDYIWINQNKKEWDYSNLNLPNTKYFQKALENGLNPMYLKLMKL
ncbi:MAG: tRNA (guanosine(46)-N7)-methyltransferase TrmB [Pelagibacteraceae bacterium]|nr:tRNA (guanosine(46)-N7)-methyltransferase TrmB [Pelagibacteraceae bacterium]